MRRTDEAGPTHQSVVSAQRRPARISAGGPEIFNGTNTDTPKMRVWSLKYFPTSHPPLGQLALGLPHVALSGAPSTRLSGTSGRLQNHCSMASVVKDVTKTPPPARLNPSPYELAAVSAYEQPWLPLTLALQSLLREW